MLNVYETQCPVTTTMRRDEPKSDVIVLGALRNVEMHSRDQTSREKETTFDSRFNA